MGSCQIKKVPFLGTLNIRCRTKIGTPKGTIILTTTHMVDCRVSILGITTMTWGEVRPITVPL